MLLAASFGPADGASAAGADERSLELVTPSTSVATINDVAGIDPQGESVVYTSIGPLPGAAAGELISYNRAARGDQGWATTPLGPPYSLSAGSLFPTEPVVFDEGLASSVWLSSVPLTPDGPPEKDRALYRRDPAGSVQLIQTLGETVNFSLVGASKDAQHVVFRTEAHLLASDAGRTERQSIYDLAGSTLRQVDLGEDGTLLSTCGSTASGTGAVSENGERIVFTSPDPSSPCEGPSRVYVRQGGAITIDVSESECTRTDCNAPQDVSFAGATPSGSSVFLVTAQQLTDDDKDTNPDLYRYDFSNHRLTLLSPGAEGSQGEVLSHEVHVSADGSRVYFYAKGQLAAAPGAQSGINLYFWEAGNLRFLGATGDDDGLQTSRDGRIAVLETRTPLTGTATDRPLLFSFDGSDSNAGKFANVERIGIDESSGDVNVIDRGHDVVSKFHPDGTAANFSATGTSSLSGAATPEGSFGFNVESDISVDNSGTATQGRIYVNAEHGSVNAFAPTGTYLWQLPASLFSDDCGTAVDASGHLWVGEYGTRKAVEFASNGDPTPIDSVSSTTGAPCRINLDRDGNVYFNIWNSKVDKYSNGAFAETLDPKGSQDIAIDQSGSSGRLFTVHSQDFSEYGPSGAFLGTSGGGTIESGRGIAYDSDLDRVYVADNGLHAIHVYGSPSTHPVAGVPVEGEDLDDYVDVYRYDATRNQLTQLSLGPSGGEGQADAQITTPLEDFHFGIVPTEYRAISEDGRRAWFSTKESLLPQDENSVGDVYEWDAGQLRLVSPGKGEDAAEFAGASRDGSTVLFRTAASLLRLDRDGGDLDLYAARLGGGFAEPAEPVECAGETCRSGFSSLPRFISPATNQTGKTAKGRLRLKLPKSLLDGDALLAPESPIFAQVPSTGLIVAYAWIERGGKAIPVGHGAAGSTRPGTVRLVIHWSGRVARTLRRGRALVMRLKAQQSKYRASRRWRIPPRTTQ